MGIAKLFAVPQGQKVTEKHLRRVLAASLCSILLCMTCLVGITWAWYTVDIENIDNVIVIGTPEIRLTVDGQTPESGGELAAGSHSVILEHGNREDDLQQKAALYVTFTLQGGGGITNGCVVLNGENQYAAELTVENNTQEPCVCSWEVSWFAPANAQLLDPEAPVLEHGTSGTKLETDPARETTEAQE